MFKELDFKPGIVTYDGFDVKTNIPFKEQLEELREDLFQVSYGEKYTIDIGWLPDGNPKGKFIIRGIKDYDWENPIYCKRTKSLARLNKLVEECVGIIRKLL